MELIWSNKIWMSCQWIQTMNFEMILFQDKKKKKKQENNIIMH
jgi:hypothetical protein